MIRYVLKRCAQAVPLLLLITILCFALIQLAPYNVIDSLITPRMTAQAIALIKVKYGYNQPAYFRYLAWLSDLLHGNLGYSLVTHASIAQDLAARLPATIVLTLPADLLATVLALLLGLAAGSRRGSLADRVIDGVCSVGIAVPGFWLAMVFIFLFGYKLGIFPIIGMHTVGREHSISDFLLHYALPFTVLTLEFLPGLVRYVRASAIGQMKENYVTVQRAFGAGPREILLRHVARNVLLPLLTEFGMSLPILVTGAVITETVFDWPGVGPYFVKAVQGLDYPVVMDILLFSAVLVILGNLLADVLYHVADPRIKQTR